METNIGAKDKREVMSEKDEKEAENTNPKVHFMILTKPFIGQMRRVWPNPDHEGCMQRRHQQSDPFFLSETQDIQNGIE